MKYITGIGRVMTGLFWLVANIVMFPLLMGKVNGRYNKLPDEDKAEVFGLVFKCMTDADAARLQAILG